MLCHDHCFCSQYTLRIKRLNSKTGSDFHLYEKKKTVVLVENQMERAFPLEIFRKKRNTFRGIPLFSFLPKLSENHCSIWFIPLVPYSFMSARVFCPKIWRRSRFSVQHAGLSLSCRRFYWSSLWAKHVSNRKGTCIHHRTLTKTSNGDLFRGKWLWNSSTDYKGTVCSKYPRHRFKFPLASTAAIENMGKSSSSFSKTWNERESSDSTSKTSKNGWKFTSHVCCCKFLVPRLSQGKCTVPFGGKFSPVFPYKWKALRVYLYEIKSRIPAEFSAGQQLKVA